MTQQWAHKTLEELLALNRSGYWGEETPSKSRPIEVKVIRNADLTKHNSIKGSASRYFSPKEAANAALQIGDIAMSSSGDVGKAWLVNEPGYFASNFIRILRPDGNYIMPSFLRYVLESDQGQAALKASTAGTTIQNLQKTFYSMLSVPLPPLAEQRRIVRLLDEALEEIAIAKVNTEKNLQNARAVFASQLESIFTKGGKGWADRPLIDLCSVFEDGDWIESKDQSSGGIRLIQTGNVGQGVFKDRAGKARFISESTFQTLRCTEIFSGDCLVSRLPDPVGRSCIVPNTTEKMITAVDCTILRFKKDLVVPEYFVYYSQSSHYLSSIAKLCTGTTRNRISRSNLGLTSIPVPSITAQRGIVEFLTQIGRETQALEASYAKKLTMLEEFSKSLLREAFAGALKVT